MLLSVRTKTTESKPVKLETIHVHCTVILALPMNSECALIPNIRGGWLAEWGYFKAICIRANRNIRNCLSIWVITSWTIGLLLLTLTYKMPPMFSVSIMLDSNICRWRFNHGTFVRRLRILQCLDDQLWLITWIELWQMTAWHPFLQGEEFSQSNGPIVKR